ncbi:hypothetical protein [Candidatus Nitrosacidococcus sp. I8]|uniref:hypothetical protein n=1 Tax=Candidatus Nitrosacidococcus sp. I8 TaxID=2942908 RepID=UPI0022277946|nr:hypothetical protein [Candidatus Nitrosacidococcus sp. I8]CAH9019658.1 hypothetical protein NURINAE_01672 [Candidatus Nitrosacidococcus sp. I8]
MKNNTETRDFHNYIIAAFTFISIAATLYLDSDSTLELQNRIGMFAWTCLLIALYWERPLVRTQVLVAVAFATIGEHFASVYMQGYIYRFHNVPAYVPPGHGFVYLTAVAFARSKFFEQHFNKIKIFVFTAGIAWSIWGFTGASQRDALGAMLFVIFIFSVYSGRSPKVYLGAFFVTTWLELIGVSYGTWRWVASEPIFQLPQGNPPSGVAAWYCLVDAVALGVAPRVLNFFNQVQIAWQKRWE